jgi:beta-glucosidase
LLIGLTETSESFNRLTLSLTPEQNDLVEKVSQINSNIIVVLSAGSPIELPSFNKVKGTIHTYLSGQRGRGALVGIPFWNVNPSWKLTETSPFSISDTSSFNHFPVNPLTVECLKSIFVGYRYYDKVKKMLDFHLVLDYHTQVFSAQI